MGACAPSVSHGSRPHPPASEKPVGGTDTVGHRGRPVAGVREHHQEGLDVLDQQVAAYRKLVKAVGGSRANGALESFEALFFNNLTLVLDRHYVHRLPGPDYEGKDGNPLNEVRIVCDSLLTNNGVMRANKQIKLPPERSVLMLNVGDPIKLSAADFERLSAAFFTELEKRFLQPGS